MSEDILQIPSFPKYSATRSGQIIRTCRGNRTRIGAILKPFLGAGGYLYVCIRGDGTKRTKTVHGLVAETFLGSRPITKQVNHKDCDKQNNCVSNLEYITAKENTRHADANGRRRLKGEGHPLSKLNDHKVRQIRTLSADWSQTALANKFGVSRKLIHNILNHKTWKHA